MRKSSSSWRPTKQTFPEPLLCANLRWVQQTPIYLSSLVSATDGEEASTRAEDSSLQGDFLEEEALELGPEGWTGSQQVDMEGEGAFGGTKGTVKIKPKAELVNVPVQGPALSSTGFSRTQK